MNMEAQALIKVMLFLIFYFAPTWVAKKGRRGGVFVVNAFLGWTLIGWVIALFMAVRSNEVKEA
jgi:hypothetical protein